MEHHKMQIRSLYNYDRNEVSESTGLTVPDDEENRMTKQEFAEEVDINTILRRFNITGQLPENVRMPTYGDFTDITDFHSAANAIAEAREAFERMPADVRLRFNNDPADFVAFCDNEQNRAEAERLGLVDPRPAPMTIPELREAFQAPTASTGGATVPAAAGEKGDTNSVT